jgi:uncharacterized protein with NAD-binding domain and iron-sulfur cluster
MKRRIAILGGGLGALSTAWELTNRPGASQRFEITVYQMGHRLGGKGASGVNRALHDRIEEHGLHIFWGFYENTFRMLREVYYDLGRPPESPLSTFEQAFFSHDLIVVPERAGDGSTTLWPLRLPRNERSPGDGLDDLLAPWDYVPRALAWVLGELGWRSPDAPGEPQGAPASGALERALRRGGELLMGSAVRGGRALRRLLEVVRPLRRARALAEEAGSDVPTRASRVLFLVRQAQRNFERLIESDETDARVRTQIDLALTLVRGLIADGLVLPPRDFHAFDDESLRGWLARHGAREETRRSPLLEGLHAAIYSSGLDIAAGTAVHGLLRIAFTYKGSILWKMRAGMGETVFAPLYQALSARGVRFRFFQRVEALRLSEDRRCVDRVELTEQAEVRGGAAYRPLVDVAGLPVWPSEPDWDQLEGGEELRASGAEFDNWWRASPHAKPRALQRGVDFDEVVLGISIGALRDLCGELTRENPRFGAMIDHVATTLTQSAQLWLSPSLDRFGHDPKDPPIVIPYAEPMDTWADMSHLLARERWPAQSAPGTCAYLTARLPDAEPVPPRGPSDYPDRVRELIRANTERWLRESAGALWPGAASADDPAALRWHWLHDDLGREGSARLEAQWIAAVPNPSDRYVLSLPGTTRHRLRSHESGFDNLVLAGDWTRNAINGGCAESAVMSGLDAARCLDPGVRPGIGDWLGALEARSKSDAPGSADLALRHRVDVAAISAAPRSCDLPRCAPRDGELLAVPPILLDVDVSMFVLRADHRALQRLLDAQLNQRPELASYRVLAPLAVLYCAKIDNHALTDPLGYVPELDFGFWIPALAGREERGRFCAERVVTFSPYLWVSNDVALTNGRAIFGYTKDLGTCMQTPNEGGEGRFALDAWVLPRFGAGRPIEPRRLFSIEPATSKAVGSAAGGLARVLGAVTNGIADRREKDAQLASLRAALALARAAPRGQRTVLLKQVPDVLDPRRACYQAVVEADIAFSEPPRVERMGGGDRVTVHEYDSHRIVRTLGLAGTATGADVWELRSLVSVRARFRATLGDSSIVWERGGAGRERRIAS